MNQAVKERIEKIIRGEVPEGYKSTKSGSIPLSWNSVKLRKLATPIKEKVQNRRLEVLSITAGVGFVNQADKFGKEIAGAQYQNYTVLRKGDFSYNKGNSKTYPQGCIYMLEDRDEAAVPNVFISFRFKAGIHTYYYKHLFINGFFNRQLYRHINTGVRNDGLLNLYDDDFYDCELPVPSLPEQEKIAEILSTWDKAILLMEKLIEEKKQRKKWLMQNLLNPDSSVRLPEFEGEWIQTTIGEFCDCLDAQRKPINSTARQKMQGPYPYYGANSIQDYISDYLFDEEIVLLAEDGGNFDDFADKPIAIYVNEKCWVNNHAHILRAKNKQTKFLFYSLEHKDIRNFINGTTRSKLTQGDMLSITIQVPKEEKYQASIANILTTADKEIDLLEQKLDQLQKQKKALMQLLLTGIVRVTIYSGYSGKGR